MAFKTDGLAKAYAGVQVESANIKRFSQDASTKLLSTVSSNAAIQVMNRMRSFIDMIDSAGAVPDILQYAKDQENDPAYDVVAEFTAMRSAAVTVANWVRDSFPKSASGEIKKDTIEANWTTTVRQFTPTESAGLRAALDALVAAIV